MNYACEHPPLPGGMNALILVDLQNDFLPGGALAVPHGDEVIPLADELQRRFDLVVATKDWHPSDHGSFAANHKRQKPGDRIILDGIGQILTQARPATSRRRCYT